MGNRSANATILGYLYQFDFSISKILDTPENDEIELEGLEDIDITQDDETKLYQCKYYSETEYNHSVIKDAIISMFTHFQINKDKKYKSLPGYLARPWRASGAVLFCKCNIVHERLLLFFP